MAAVAVVEGGAELRGPITLRPCFSLSRLAGVARATDHAPQGNISAKLADSVLTMAEQQSLAVAQAVAGGCRGTRNQNVLPCPRALLTPISPSWAMIAIFANARPRPEPAMGMRWAIRPNFSKIIF